MTQKQADKLFLSKSFTIDLFGKRILFFNNLEDFNKCMDWRGHEKCTYSDGLAYHSFFVDENGKNDNAYLMGVFDKNLCTLVHESTHIALFILDTVGHEITKNDEILPYLIDTIFNHYKDKI